MTVTRNNKFLITGDWVGYGGKISVPNGHAFKEIYSGTVLKDMPKGTVVADFARRFQSLLAQI
jgi:hypothetical protein